MVPLDRVHGMVTDVKWLLVTHGPEDVGEAGPLASLTSAVTSLQVLLAQWG